MTTPSTYSDAAFWLDVGVLVWLLGGLVGGAVRGLTKELGRGVLSVGALVAGWLLHRPVGALLERGFGLSPHVASAAAFVAAAIAAVVVLMILGNVFQWLVNFSFRGPIERFGGALAGLLGAGVAAFIVLVIAHLLPFPLVRETVARQSWFGRRVCATFPALYREWSDRLDALKSSMETAPAGEPRAAAGGTGPDSGSAAEPSPAPSGEEATAESDSPAGSVPPAAEASPDAAAPPREPLDDGTPRPVAVDGWGRPLDPAAPPAEE